MTKVAKMPNPSWACFGVTIRETLKLGKASCRVARAKGKLISLGPSVEMSWQPEWTRTPVNKDRPNCVPTPPETAEHGAKPSAAKILSQYC